MSETIKVMISEEDIDRRIRELGEEISKEYAGESVYLAVVLRGAVYFGCELSKRITLPVTIDFISASSYGSGTVSSGNVLLKNDLEISVKNRNVIIVEDIIDSGNTLKKLYDHLSGRGVKSLKLCTLLDKPSRREADIEADYTGFVIPDAFVVGYGLDYDQKYRNLPYIGEVELD